MPDNEFFRQLRDLVSLGEISSAVERLINFLKGVQSSQLLNEASVHSARLNRLQRDERMGLLSREQAEVSFAKIAHAVSLFIQEVERVVTLFPATGRASDVTIDAAQLEKIFGQRQLIGIAWLELGLSAARSVCRIVLPDGLGTGFLIDGGIVVTNHHVLPDSKAAAAAVAEFGFEEDVNGRLRKSSRYRFDAASFRASATFDVACARLIEQEGEPPITSYGALSLVPATPPKVGDHVNIIQHPDGGPKMIAAVANQVVALFDHRVQYLTDTLPGSSGSPVFNQTWQVVAVHRAGGNLLTNRAGTRRFANEGILCADVVTALGLG